MVWSTNPVLPVAMAEMEHRHQDLKPLSAGFTIVEVIIVMAIAGLILLIVLNVIPALERSSRNNQRKQDAAFILDTVSHSELSNSGNFPVECGSGQDGPSGGFGIIGFNCDQPSAFLNNLMNKIVYYQASNIGLLDQTASSGNWNSRQPQPGPNDVDKIEVFDYEKCDASSPGKATIVGAGYNDVVALYTLESGSGGKLPQCEQL